LTCDRVAKLLGKVDAPIFHRHDHTEVRFFNNAKDPSGPIRSEDGILAHEHPPVLANDGSQVE
jgi:hypothetical protein